MLTPEPLPGMPRLYVDEVPAKRCRLCGETKPCTEFHLAADGRRGLYRSECKSCALDLARRAPRPLRRLRRTHCADCGAELTDENCYRRSGSASFRSPCIPCRAKLRRRKHDEAEEERRRDIAGERCEICGATETVTRGGRVRRPTIDHNHETGEVRGVLCSRCNSGIGLFRDSPILLRLAADYLDRHGSYSAVAGAEAITGEQLEVAHG